MLLVAIAVHRQLAAQTRLHLEFSQLHGGNLLAVNWQCLAQLDPEGGQDGLSSVGVAVGARQLRASAAANDPLPVALEQEVIVTAIEDLPVSLHKNRVLSSLGVGARRQDQVPEAKRNRLAIDWSHCAMEHPPVSLPRSSRLRYSG